MSYVTAPGSNEVSETARMLSNQSNDMIVIHGFGSRDVTPAKSVLEDWIKPEARKNNLKTHCYSFDTAHVLQGGAVAWRRECERLQTWLALSGPKLLAAELDSTHAVHTDERHRGNPSLRPGIFVVHGLAAWILKDVLSVGNYDLDSRLTAILHLDGPRVDFNIDKKADVYVEYLTELAKGFLTGPFFLAFTRVEECKQRIMDADRKFRQKLAHYQEDISFMKVSSVVQRRFDLWLYDDNISGIVKPCHTEWEAYATQKTDGLSNDGFRDTLIYILKYSGPPEPHACYTAGSELRYKERNAHWIDVKMSSIIGEHLGNWINVRMSSLIGDHSEDGEIPSYIRRPSLNVQLLDDDDQPLSRTYNLAAAYFKRIELSWAEELFSYCYQEMSESESSDQNQVHILMQIISVRMSLGKYLEAKENLNRMLGTIDESSLQTHEEHVFLSAWNRLRAIWHLRTGDWANSAMIFEDLKKWGYCTLEIARDVALAYAYEGDLFRATINIKLAWEMFHRMSPDLDHQSSVSDASVTRDLKQESLRTTEAEIYLSAGFYRSAFTEADGALRNLSRILGPKHLKTLSVASIKALCFAHCSQYQEAEELCLATLDIIAQELGRQHPLFIQAMTTLVYIFRCQDRCAEAISTGYSLLKLVPDQRKARDPHKPRVEFQLAAAHFANGDYMKAANILENILELSDVVFYPDVLRYQLELSLVYFSTGKTRKAMDLALHVAVHLIQRDGLGTTTNGVSSISDCADCKKGQISDERALRYLATQVRDRISRGLMNRFHPWFTVTLQHLATMITRVQDDERRGYEYLRVIVREVRKLYDKNVGIARDTEKVRLDFVWVLLLRETRLDRTIDFLQSIVKWRDRQFGGSHIETIRAYRELMVAYSKRALSNLAQGMPVDISLGEVERRSIAILVSLESTVGSNHPETIQSRLWCFTVTLLVSSHQKSSLGGDVNQIRRKVCNEAETIISRIRAPLVWQERYIEVLNIEKTVIELLLEADIVDKPLEDFLEYAHTDIARAIDKNLEKPDEEISAKIEELHMSFGELSKSYQRACSG